MAADTSTDTDNPWESAALDQHYQFVRTVAFREFQEWAASALQQMLKRQLLLPKHSHQRSISQYCTKVENRLCQNGTMELYFHKYSYPILDTVWQTTTGIPTTS